MCVMKKLFICTLLISALSFSLKAEISDEPSEPCCANSCENSDDCCWDSGYEVSIGVAAFFPNSKRAKRVYADAWRDYQVEVKKLFCDWSFWVNGQYIHNHGKSYGFYHRSTHINVFPISLGANYNFDFSECECFKSFLNGCFDGCLMGYAGGGPTYGYLSIEDHYEHVKEHTHKNGWGGLFKLGLQCFFMDGFYADFFVNYLILRFNNHSDDSCSSYTKKRDIRLNGFMVGTALGYRF